VLEKTGNSRSAVYHLAGLSPPLDPNDVFGPENDTTHSDDYTTHLKEKNITRNEEGCIIHTRLPIIDKVDSLSKNLREKLEQVAISVRTSGRIGKEEVAMVI